MFPRRRDAAPGTQPDLQTAAEGHADVRPALLSYRILTPNAVRSTERLGPRRADGAVQSSAAARAEERSPPSVPSRPRRAGVGSRDPSRRAQPRAAPLTPAEGRSWSRRPRGQRPVLPDAARRRCSRPALLPGHETAGTPPGGAAPPPPSHSAPVWPGLHSTGTAEPRHAAARTPPRTPGSWQPSLARAAVGGWMGAGGQPEATPRKAGPSAVPSPGAALSSSKLRLEMRPAQRPFQVVAGRHRPGGRTTLVFSDTSVSA